MQSIAWTSLDQQEPELFFVQKFYRSKKYEKGFKIDELFKIFTSGVKTHDDSNLYQKRIRRIQMLIAMMTPKNIRPLRGRTSTIFMML